MSDKQTLTLPEPGAWMVAVIAILLFATFGVAAIAGGSTVSGTVPLNATNGPAVAVDSPSGSTLDLTSSAFPNNNTVDVTHSDGNATFSSGGPTNVSVDAADLEGSRTQVTGVDAASNDLTINPDDKRAVTVGGGMDQISFEDVVVDDGNSEFGYAASSSASVTFRDIGVTSTTVIAVDGSGTTVGSGTVDGSGDVTFSSLDSGTHSGVSIQTANVPVLSNPQPPDGGNKSTTPVTLEVNVTDGDFGSPGDTVTVEFYNDETNSLIGTDTVSSNGTASVTWSNVDAGRNEWRADASDTFGGTDSTGTLELNTATTLTIFNESAPNTKVTQPSGVKLTFFGDDPDNTTVVERNTTNGEVDMSGLPVNTEFAVEIESDGYVTRQAIIKTIVRQQSIYLLPENTSRVTSRFQVNDQTGNFPQDESTVFVKKPLNKTSGTDYVTVAADRLGPEGFTTQLESEQRYRIVLENPDGDIRQFQPYGATVNETVTLDVADVEFALTEQEPVNWGFEVDGDGGGNSTLVRFSYRDPTSKTTNLDVTIHERGNESNVILNTTKPGPVGDVVLTKTLPGDNETTNYQAEWTATRGSEQISSQRFAGERGTLTSLRLPDWMKHGISVFGILLVAGLGSRINAPTVGIGCGFVASLAWFIGWLPAAVSGSVIVAAVAISVLYLSQRRGGI